MRAKTYTSGLARVGLVPLLVVWVLGAVLPANGAVLSSKPHLYARDVAVSEGGTGIVKVLLSAPAPSGGVAFTMKPSTTSTAKSSLNDYTVPQQSYTIAQGQTSLNVPVVTLQDTAIELTEKAVFMITSTQATVREQFGNATVHILDDDLPISASVDDDWTVEGDTGQRTVTLTVKLDRAPTSAVSLKAYTVDGSAKSLYDYTKVAKPSSPNINFGIGETSKTFSVKVNGDRTVERHEVFYVQLSNPVGVRLADSRAGVGIRDDDDKSPGTPLPRLYVGDGAAVEPNVEATNVTIPLRLVDSPPAGKSSTVKVYTRYGNATLGSDYDGVSYSAPQTFTWTASGTKNLVIPIKGDQLHENRESLQVIMSTPGNAVFGDSRGIVSILDNDGPLFFGINESSAAEDSANNSVGGTMTFDIEIYPTPEVGEVVRLRASTSDGSAKRQNLSANPPVNGDYKRLGGDAAAYYNIPQFTMTQGGPTKVTVPVDLVADNLDEDQNGTTSDESFLVTVVNRLRISGDSTALPAAVIGADPNANGVILDND